MAVVKKNIITQGLSGELGGAIVFRQVGGRTIVSTPPTQSGELSEKQKVQRDRFQQAAFFAKAQMLNPVTKAAYQAATDEIHPNPYTVAVADFLRGPDIEEIEFTNYTGKVGDTIRIRVMDNFRVDDVHVTIENTDGSLVEKGNALQQPNVIDWLYTATKANASLDGDKITIRANDFPGNIDTEVKVI
ncbi:MAG: hypothetical protein V4714_05635 [Bacteroidota bacterium]